MCLCPCRSPNVYYKTQWCGDVQASGVVMCERVVYRRNAQYACTESVRASMWNRLVPHAQYADLVFAVPSSWIRRVRFFRPAKPSPLATGGCATSRTSHDTHLYKFGAPRIVGITAHPLILRRPAHPLPTRLPVHRHARVQQSRRHFRTYPPRHRRYPSHNAL